MKRCIHPLWKVILLLVTIGCAGGYGIKVGYQKKLVYHKGYTSQQIYTATLLTLKKIGIVTREDPTTGTVEGEIPPFRVKGSVKPGSSWLKLEAWEQERGRWHRSAARGEWWIDMDGKLIYRQGAVTLQTALREWSRAINRLIPAR